MMRPPGLPTAAWRWHGANAARSMGIPGWLALGLIVVCAGVAAFVTVPLAADTQRLVAEVESARQRQAARAEVAPPASPREQLDAFARRFVGETEIAPAIAQLQALARKRGVQLDQAEFRLFSEPTEPLSRYVIVLPVKAEYGAVRLFCRDALREMPAISLEEVNVRRADAKAPLLEAQLRLVLFVRPDAARGDRVRKVT
jgi:hypothetical protein